MSPSHAAPSPPLSQWIHFKNLKMKNSLDGLKNKSETLRERFSDIEDQSKSFTTKKDSRRNLESRLHERSQTQGTVYTI